MKLPQLVVYETDGWLASQLRRLAKENAWLIRESRHVDACVELVSECRPSVLFLKIEHPLVDGFSLLGDVMVKAPDCPVVVVSDAKLEGADQRAQFSALAFDLGARYVLFPPLQQPVIEDLAAGLMAATIKRVVGISIEEASA